MISYSRLRHSCAVKRVLGAVMTDYSHTKVPGSQIGNFRVVAVIVMFFYLGITVMNSHDYTIFRRKMQDFPGLRVYEAGIL